MNVPASTYRLQLHAEFTFDDAAAIAPYLVDLGVTCLYVSPILQSATGSTHGYDVTDPTRIDADRGGADGFDRLCERCRELGLGIVIDIVPNHMDVASGENPWWQDVLTHGSESEWAKAFDIDWDAPGAEGRIIVPTLGGDPADEIASGALRFEEDDEGEVVVRYHDKSFPVSPDTEVDVENATNAEIAAALDEQPYELAEWREGGRRINYRRFFDIDSLASIRVEDPDVFDATHALIIELTKRPEVIGLRVDHPDGLRDPAAYFERLAEATDVWIVAEKILEADETLPAGWSVAGTTGYDFLNDALAVQIAPAAESTLTALYEAFVGEQPNFSSIVRDAKRRAGRKLLPAGLARLARVASKALAHAGEEPADAKTLETTLLAMAVGLDVYRTYFPTGADGDAERLRAAADVSAADNADPSLASRLADLMATSKHGEPSGELAARFQQFTAPLTAKGVEDTAFYRYNRFVALNEVGGDPSRFSLSANDYHERTERRSRDWPAAMLTTATHDTKRSEDVRARLSVLSERPGEWEARVTAWRNDITRLGGDGLDPNDIYLLLQTLVGAWPITADRVEAFMIKAAREAKRRTSWRESDESYEKQLTALSSALINDHAVSRSVGSFVDDIRSAGRVKSLTQIALKLAGPGVPDTYQGCELWDLSLVDPDNRRAVDFDERRHLLASLEAMSPARLWATIDDANDPGVTKLWLTRTLLRVRRSQPEVLGGSSPYTPLVVTGPDAGGVIAFARGANAEIVVVAPLRSSPAPTDATIELPTDGAWTNLCDGARIDGGERPIGAFRSVAPLAILAREGADA